MGDLVVIRLLRSVDRFRRYADVLVVCVGGIPRRTRDHAGPTQREGGVSTKNLFLIGKAGVGKDTVAERLWIVHRLRLFALASPIKEFIGGMLDRDVTKADRALMIDFGQKYREWFGADVWCRLAMEDVQRRWKSDDRCANARNPVVITDGRHLVEFDYFVVQRGFIPVRIVCDDETRFARLLERDGVDQRAVLAGQETELDGVEVAWTIDNNGTKDDLYRQVDEMMRKIRGEA